MLSSPEMLLLGFQSSWDNYKDSITTRIRYNNGLDRGGVWV